MTILVKASVNRKCVKYTVYQAKCTALLYRSYDLIHIMYVHVFVCICLCVCFVWCQCGLEANKALDCGP